VSGAHAELHICKGSLLVRDLGSTNGTFVNGVRVREECEVNHGDLLQFAQTVFRTSRNKSHTFNATLQEDSADRALALIQFDKLMTDRAVLPHFQPIVDINDRAVLGYEILGRSRLFGLSDPQTMFMAAAVLNLEAELSRIFRTEGMKAADPLPGNSALFANTHPSEINDLDLLVLSLRELRESAPDRPMVLEIHEATATRSEQMRELRAAMNDLDIRLAYDDFGAGQARLVELVEVPPDYLKFDMKLVRGLAEAPADRQRVVERLVQMTRELGINALAEGIETEADCLACQQCGFQTAQGYLFGRPAIAESFCPTLVASR
jgi:EAL domain-containing protein (putative c-di-GMP-specific phosphodiesterase class I)